MVDWDSVLWSQKFKQLRPESEISFISETMKLRVKFGVVSVGFQVFCIAFQQMAMKCEVMRCLIISFKLDFLVWDTWLMNPAVI